MALFLRGKYIGFYDVGATTCVRDIFRFHKSAENKIYLDITRRAAGTTFQRFHKLESARFTLHPLDEEDPRQGGKVTVKSLIFDVRTFTLQMKTLYGIYGDDFIQFGEFQKNTNPLEDEELLLKITEDVENSDDVLQRSTFRFENDELTYTHDVNHNLLDGDLHHAIPESQLVHSTKRSWSEIFFYGVGNQSM